MACCEAVGLRDVLMLFIAAIRAERIYTEDFAIGFVEPFI